MSDYSVNVNVSFRHTDATDALRDYAKEKVSHCVQKFAHQDVEAHVVLSVERNRQIAEVSFHSDGADFHSCEESENMYSSIDSMATVLSHQLRKHKEKLVDHHR